MSRIIRHTTPSQSILIGDRKFNPKTENNAERRLAELFPVVTVMTQPDGSKGIPIEEVFEIDKTYQSALQKAHKQGHEQGYKSGYEAGKSDGLKEAIEIVNQLGQAVNDAVSQRARILEEARHNVVDLIIDVAKKVTFDTIKVDHDMIAQMVARVIDQLVDKSHIKVNVNPDHLPIVEQYLDKFLTDSTTIKDISFHADPRVRYGGCFIETPSGDIDARLASQFEVVEQILSDEED